MEVDVEIVDRIKYLRSCGNSWNVIASELGISRSTLFRVRTENPEVSMNLDVVDVKEKIETLQQIGMNWKQISSELGIPVSTLRRKRKQLGCNGSIGKSELR